MAYRVLLGVSYILLIVQREDNTRPDNEQDHRNFAPYVKLFSVRNALQPFTKTHNRQRAPALVLLKMLPEIK